MILKNEIRYVIKEKICAYFNQPNELNEIIKKTDVVIDFVISTGCSKDMKIVDYMVNVLKIKNIEDIDLNELKVIYIICLFINI